MRSYLEILWTIRTYAAFAFLSSLSSGLLAPLVDFVGMNHFAPKYTDLPKHKIACQNGVEAPHCKSAIMDYNAIQNVCVIATPFCLLLVLPAIGVLSDGFGRKPALYCAWMFSVLNTVSMATTVFFDFGYYVSVLLRTLTQADKLVYVIVSAPIIDLLEGEERGIGFALSGVMSTVGPMLGTIIGSYFDMKTAILVGIGIELIALLFIVFVVSETHPAERRSFDVTLKSFQPLATMPILWKTPTIFKFTLYAIASSFVYQGTFRMMPPLWMSSMPWTATDNYHLQMTMMISQLIWFAAFLPLLLRYTSEVFVLILSSTFFLVHVIPAILASQPWMVCATLAFVHGPIFVLFPTISALKSRLVEDSEQARMQSALNAVFEGSAAVGALLFGLMFQHAGNANLSSFRRNVAFIDILGSTLLLWLLLMLRRQMQAERPKDLENGAIVESGMKLTKEPYEFRSEYGSVHSSS